MNKRTHNFSTSRLAFVEALAKYQAASRDMSIALLRLTGQTHGFCEALQVVVSKTGAMVAESR